MAVLTIDFSQSNDELIPEGIYDVTVDKVEAKESSSNPAPNLNWTFTIVRGEHTGRKVFLTTGTSERARWKLGETLRNLGIDTNGLQLITDDASNLVVQPRLAGLEAKVKVAHREWEGRKRAGVESVLGGGNGHNGASGNGANAPQFR